MKLKFYGTRGSIPICDAGFQQFSGNTTCLQITFTDTNRIAVIDAGTGLRNLGRDLRRHRPPAGSNRYRVLTLSLGLHPRLSVLCSGL
jgi:hypothetical protein